MPHNLLAIDLGAESGRAILGTLDREQLTLADIHRFPNVPVRLPDGLHWDVLRLWSEIKTALQRVTHKHHIQLAGIGLDTWGVDFGLLDRAGALIGNPFHYRDGRTDGMLEAACQRLPRERIFDLTGIQFMQLNTLYQLFSLVLQQAPALQIAETFLTMPDLFNSWLSGRQVCEFTMATTTQCYDPRRCEWSQPLLKALSIPLHIFPEVVPPGTVLGEVLPDIAEETGCGRVPVIAPACHDTGSAVAAVPAVNKHFAWISSGTWSIMGAEADRPIVNAQSLKYNFTNEGGVNGTWRFSKNIMGLWPVQECRRTWARAGEELSYAEITQLAAGADPFQSIIDVDTADFFQPGDMPARIQQYCAHTQQPVPESKGAIIRCVLESLALKYRWVLDRLEEMLGYRLEPIHIIGGGTQSYLLNQLTANATARTVIAGPIEATAIGNVLLQAVALGQLTSLEEARAVVRHSFKPETYEPHTSAKWDVAYQKLQTLMQEA
ncbi:MAG TPA: rhamnulokinase family protein [Anaerolineae bacterium]|nr:rhamnulokinase family protein [Anaerolineae bacterium]